MLRLEMTGVAKRFGATVALRGVDLALAAGEVHALIGENGAGKSTLMKILSGALAPDAGGIRVDGVPFAPGDPQAARRHGVAMIYQELAIAADLTVAENILLGDLPATAGWIRAGERDARARAALTALGRGDLALGARAGDLPPAEQQMVEIARALVGEPKVLVLDEPTSSLTRADAERLFAAVAQLKARGVAVVYISHALEECRAIADRFTVLRDGASVGSGAMAGVDVDHLIRLMVGRAVEDIYPRVPHVLGGPALTVRGLRGRAKPAEASFVLRQGEILGVFGLVGAGRTETLRALFGLDRLAAGEVVVFAQDRAGAAPARLLADGVGLVSEDRKREGLLLDQPIADNLTLTRLAPYRRWGWLSPRAQRAAARSWMERLGVKAAGPAQAVGELSGGNQQKVAIGRLLHHDCRVLLLDEPTRGVDIGAKAAIYRLIGERAAAGVAVIMVSSYLPELLGVCDTIAVMARGRLGTVRPVAEWSEHGLLAAAFGQEAA